MRRFLDWLLGPHCTVCGCRVFPADLPNHPKDCS